MMTTEFIKIVANRFNINIHEAVDEVWDAIELIFDRADAAAIDASEALTEAEETHIYQYINNKLTMENQRR